MTEAYKVRRLLAALADELTNWRTSAMLSDESKVLTEERNALAGEVKRLRQVLGTLAEAVREYFTPNAWCISTT